MVLTRFHELDIKPSTVVWKIDGYHRLPLFWIYREDFLKAIGYSEWAEEFEQKVIFDAIFAFTDYLECKASKKGKKVND